MAQTPNRNVGRDHSSNNCCTFEIERITNDVRGNSNTNFGLQGRDTS